MRKKSTNKLSDASFKELVIDATQGRSDELETSEFSFCCGMNEIGQFYEDAELDEQSEDLWEDVKNDDDQYKYCTQADCKRAILQSWKEEIVGILTTFRNPSKKTYDNWIGTLNKKSQSKSIAIIKEIAKEHPGFTFKSIISAGTRNELLFFMYIPKCNVPSTVKKK